MPQHVIKHLTLCSLFFVTGAYADSGLNWMTSAEMAALPEDQQRSIPVWCGGIYHNPGIGQPDPDAPAELAADTLTLTESDDALLSGGVEITQPGRRIMAENARLNQQTGDFSLTRGARIETHDASFTAMSMTGNTRSRAGQLDDVNYALFANHARGDANRIDISPEEVLIHEGSYTTCAPGNNGWLLTGKNIRLNQESGWGQARNITLRVKDVPVFWFPWVTFPIDDTRKSGLLFPSLSLGDGGGLDMSVPIYLNLHPQFDATVAPRFVAERGSGVDNEFRYLTPIGEGAVSYGAIFSDRKFDNRNREIARWQHEGNIDRWALTTDVNYVSDDFYFKDLETGLDVRSQTHLPLLAQARYLGRTWQILARLQSWQTIDPTLDEADLPYRRLPQLQVTGRPNLFGPVDMLWLSDLTYFDRSDSENTVNPVGGRAHLAPALNMRLWQPWGYLEPRARIYHNSYKLENLEVNQTDTPRLTTWGASLDAGLNFERPATLFGSSFNQTLEPRLFINYVSFEDQQELPNFDAGTLTFSYNTLFRENRFIGFDRIGDEEKISLGVTSRFLRNDNGNEQLRLRIGQGYFLSDRRVQLRGNEDLTASQTPVVADARWNFGQHWHLYTEGQWNTSEQQRERSTVRLGYNDRSRTLFNIGVHDRPTDDIRETELSAIYPIHPNWRLIGRWIYDAQNNRTLESMGGAEFRNCCWQIRLLSQRELTDFTGDGQLTSDNVFWMQIQMTGLGGFGGRMDELLRRSIPGYRNDYD